MTIEEVVRALRAGRYRVSTEAALQSSIEEALAAAGISFEREARLSPGERIDFFVPRGIGVEAKVRYPRRSIYRQLERYALHDAITGLVLISGTALGLPASINGKPIHFISLGRTSL